MQRPAVGVAAIIERDGLVLLGKRLTGHGAGTWQFPGGHLEYGETIAGCAMREAAEETGLQLANPRAGPYTNDVFGAEGRHYVTLYVRADAPAGEPVACEPAKCAGWAWFRWDALPQPLFLPIENLLRAGAQRDGSAWTPC